MAELRVRSRLVTEPDNFLSIRQNPPVRIRQTAPCWQILLKQT